MTSSSFLLSGLPQAATVATGYEYYNARYHAHPPADILQLASGNLYTTVVDLAAFTKRLLAAGEAPDAALPRPQSLHEMFEPQFARPEDPQRNGLGWMTSEEALSELLVWHQGGDFDANALVAMLPGSRLGVALLANTGGYDGSALVELALEVFRVLLAEREGAPRRKAHGPADDWPTAPERESYAGRYIAYGETLEVFLSRGELRARWGPASLRLDADRESDSDTVFAPHHWLESLGLEGLLPADLSAVRFIFPPTAGGHAEGLFIGVSDLAYEYCPRYPVQEIIPEGWARVAGAYEGCEISVEDGMLRMSGVGYLAEREPDVFVVLGGPFAAETVIYDSAVETVYHQGRAYPRAPDRSARP
jgi:hypothetical protein